MALSIQQQEIYDAMDEKILVIAAPASGKTRLLTEKVKKAINEEGGNIVVITFTNAAAEEMSQRIGKIPQNCFIGTVHSYANYLLIKNNINTFKALEEENFDELFYKIEEYPQVVEPVDYLFLDEAQDSTELQFNFILDIVNPKKWFIVADHRQSIYEWNGGRPDILLELSEDMDVTTFELNENFRNGSEILAFAKTMLRPLGLKFRDNSICKSGIDGKVLKIDYELYTLRTLIEQKSEYGSWFVLTRTNEQLQTVYNYLKKHSIPCDSFKKAQLSSKALSKKMRANTVKVLTIHSAKGLENDYVAVIGAKFYRPEERRLAYVAATRARKLLVWIKSAAKVDQRMKIF